MRSTILIFLLVAAASFLWLRSGDRLHPVEVPLEDTKTWMERMREPGEILFVAREPVATAAVDPVPPTTPSRTVSTLGPLDEPVEAALVANFQVQLQSLEQQIRDCPASADGDPLGQLEAELKVAELTLTKVRKEFAIDQIRANDYVTVRAAGPLPPKADGYDQMGHSNVIHRGEAVQVVFYVPQGDARVRGAIEYRNALYQGYWEAFVATFNAQPLETRKARIARHRQARSQHQAQHTNANIRDRLSPEELKAAIIRGPIEIDDVSWTLSVIR